MGTDIMIRIVNEVHETSLQEEIFNSKFSDFQFLTEDGPYYTSKALLFSAFPALSSMLCSSCASDHSLVSVTLLEVSLATLKSAVEIMMTHGDSSALAQLLGYQTPPDPPKDATVNSDWNDEIRQSARIFFKESPKTTDSLVDDDHYAADIIKSEEDDQESMIKHIKLDNDQFLKMTNVKTIKRPAALESDNKCTVCDKLLSSKRKLKKHMISIHEKMRSCNVCNETFVGFQAWTDHNKICYFTCDQCDFKERRLNRFEGHKRRHFREQNGALNEDDPIFTKRITVVYK